jgi:hypothetical protein
LAAELNEVFFENISNKFDKPICLSDGAVILKVNSDWELIFCEEGFSHEMQNFGNGYRGEIAFTVD